MRLPEVDGGGSGQEKNYACRQDDFSRTRWRWCGARHRLRSFAAPAGDFLLSRRARSVFVFVRRRLNQSAPGGFAAQTLQIGAHLRSVLEAQFAILLQSLVDDAFELAWDLVVEAHRRDWRFVQNAVENRGRRIALERQNTRGHFVQHRAE